MSLRLLAGVALLVAGQGAADVCQSTDQRFINSDGGCFDTINGLVWSEAPGLETDHHGADEYCRTQVGEPGQEWRLPKADEFKTLAADPALWSRVRLLKPFTFYWVAAAPEASRARLFTPTTDRAVAIEEAYEDRRSFRGAFVCVRRAFGCARDDGAFASAAGGCLQRASGLAWSRVAERSLFGRSAARYCSGLIQGARDDWRLPTVGELQGLAGPDFGESHLDLRGHREFWAIEVDVVEKTVQCKEYRSSYVDLFSGQSEWHNYGVYCIAWPGQRQTADWDRGPFDHERAVICVR